MRRDPSWAHRIVVDILSAHDHLQELLMMTTAYDDDRFVVFPAIPRLRGLSVDQPTDWMVYVRCRWTADFLTWIDGTIRASPQLKSMRFLCTAADCAEVCKILQDENIRLKGVSSPRSYDALYSYLASYSGILERLEIFDVQDSAHGKMLYERIIPQNAASLVVLRLPGCEEGREGPCALKSQQITVISQLEHLETLEIAVEGSGPGALRAIVYRLLETVVDSMPALKNIGILPACSPHAGGCNRSNQLDHYAEYGLAQIEAAVREFEKDRRSVHVRRLLATHRRRLEDIEKISRGYIFGRRNLDVVVGRRRSEGIVEYMGSPHPALKRLRRLW